MNPLGDIIKYIIAVFLISEPALDVQPGVISLVLLCSVLYVYAVHCTGII